MHWDARSEDDSAPLWYRLAYRARKRMNVLVSGDSSSLGVYGLGNKRTLEDYAEQCGIDYLTREPRSKSYAIHGSCPARALKLEQAAHGAVTRLLLNQRISKCLVPWPESYEHA